MLRLLRTLRDRRTAVRHEARGLVDRHGVRAAPGVARAAAVEAGAAGDWRVVAAVDRITGHRHQDTATRYADRS